MKESLIIDDLWMKRKEKTQTKKESCERIINITSFQHFEQNFIVVIIN